MNFFKVLFEFNRKEQFAILALVAIMLGTIATLLLSNRFIKSPFTEVQGLDDSIQFYAHSFSKQKPSTNKPDFDYSNPDVSVVQQNLNPFPFNPNHLSEEKWRELGLKENQIRNILNYKRSGGKFYRNEDFAKIYTISAEEYAILEPYIILENPVPTNSASPVEKTSKKEEIKTNFEPKEPSAPIEINQVDSLELIKLPGIGPWFSHRILKYRQALGGYNHIEQLLEVYGIDELKFNQISPYFFVENKHIIKLKINHLTFKELLKHPYLEFEQVKAIMNQRDRRGFIQSDTTLMRLIKLDEAEFERLKPYVSYE